MNAIEQALNLLRDADEPLAALGVASIQRAMTDGTIRDDDLAVAGTITPGELSFGEHVEAAHADEDLSESGADYGLQASLLRRDGVFRNPAFWPLAGTTKDYTNWLSKGKSIVSKSDVEVVVRLASEGESPYFHVPLTEEEVKKIRAEGWESFGDKGWWQKKRLDLLVAWCWEAIKERVGAEHWSQVAPTQFREWLTQRDESLLRYLPGKYI